MPLYSYHLAWLTNHPERSEEWLKARLSDGFDVHHLDGNHSNDEPDNLALIEHADHMRLHGFSMRRSFGMAPSTPEAAPREEANGLGRAAYEAKCEDLSWPAVARSLAISGPNSGSKARYEAKCYATAIGLPWPRPAEDLKAKAAATRMKLGCAAYEARDSSTTWAEIERHIAARTPPHPTGSTALNLARWYAKEAGLAWPKPV